MNQALLTAQLQELPLYEYAFLKTSQLTFSERVRVVCRQECPMYGKSWACPPAVGTVEDCMALCHTYEDVLMISTITEVSDIQNLEETLSTRGDHEALTRQVRDLVAAQANETMVLSTEACAICDRCAYPDGPCRHPDRMFPCVESHGILLTALAETLGIDFLAGSNLVTWFSLIFYR